MAEPLAGSAKGVPILKHQVIPFARQINPGIDRNDPQAAVTAIELRFPGTFSHKAWRVIRYMEGAMFLYAYKGKFIATDESLELTGSSPHAATALTRSPLAHRAGRAVLWMSWKAGWSKLRTNTTSWLRFPDGR